MNNNKYANICSKHLKTGRVIWYTCHIVEIFAYQVGIIGKTRKVPVWKSILLSGSI